MKKNEIEKLLKNGNPVITKTGKKVYLKQTAYLSGSDIIFFEAAGIDADGNDYQIIWNILCEDADDDRNACDWNKPKSVKKL